MLRDTSTRYGKLRGLPGNDPRITVYKGIPFAKPPVGDLRWRRPMPLDEGHGDLDAYVFAPISIQDVPGLDDNVYTKEWHVDPDISMDEDCLYLNIWTPAKSCDEKLPVLVWFFGGAFQWGYTPEMEFNGERLARRGIIVVSINYRLGAIGFLAHRDLTLESPDAPANFGLLDQQAGLKWVYENIASFGGDPRNITIAGQSAGGGSVLNQMCNSDNYDMLKGAAIISGLIRIPDVKEDILIPMSLERAEEVGGQFLNYLGVNGINEARKLDAFYIRDKYAEFVKDHPRFAPVMDRAGYSEDAYYKFRSGRRAQIPVMTGYTTDEFSESGVNLVKKTVTEAVPEAVSNCSAPVYVYEFAAPMPGDDEGVFHSSDLWFWFETLNMCWRPFGGAHFELAKRMCDCLADFVKYHSPSADGSWLPATTDNLNTVRFDCQAPAERSY